MNKIDKIIAIILLATGLGGGCYWFYFYSGRATALELPANFKVQQSECGSYCAPERLARIQQETRNLFQEKKIRYLTQTVYETNLIDGLDIAKFPPYSDNPALYEEYARKYADLVAEGYVAPISVRFVNDIVGYGVFAEAPIKAGQLVGEYTGIVRDKIFVKDTTYSWVYPSKVAADGKTNIAVSLDSKYAGNEMRYVNHAKHQNTKKVDVPGHDGKWHIVYIATKDIPVDKQVTVSYGDRYWLSRGKNPQDFD